jgi:hypothetical protein
MKRYQFTVRLTGFGNTPDEAWLDAIGATDLDSDPTPSEEDIQDLGEENEE